VKNKYQLSNPRFCEHDVPCLMLDKIFDPDKSIETTQQTEDELDQGKALRCAYCQTIVTYPANAISQLGQHIHSFTNPGGYEFTIGCFRQAYCQAIGTPSQEWTWFPSYYWQYALCHHCQEHLGWYYQSGEATSGFYGLILNRLISGTDH